MKRRKFLTALLGLMLVMTGTLAVLFVILRTSTEAPAAVESPGLEHVRTLYGWGETAEELFQQPYSVVWQNGSLYVGLKGTGEIVRLTPEGELLSRFGERGREPGQIWSLTGFDVDPQGTVYAADGGHNKIVVYAPDGEFVTEIALDEKPIIPRYDGNRLLITTPGSILAYSLPGGELLFSWGERGRGVDQFDFPNGLAVLEEAGWIFVSDGNNLRAKGLSLQGETRWIYGEPPEDMNDRDREFGLAGGLATDGEYVYITDPLDSVIHILDLEGNHLAQVGENGAADGQFNYPSDITYMGDSRFAVAEWASQRVQIIDIDAESAAEDWSIRRSALGEEQGQGETEGGSDVVPAAESEAPEGAASAE